MPDPGPENPPDKVSVKILYRAIRVGRKPGRTADIEQTLVIGVHGPKEVHLVLLDPVQAKGVE